MKTRQAKLSLLIISVRNNFPPKTIEGLESHNRMNVMKHFSITLTLLGFLLIVFTSSNALAKQTTLVYEVYAGGINALQARLNLDLQPNTFQTSLTANTKGFLGAVAPWQGQYSTKGFLKNGEAHPLQHVAKSTWRDEVETKTYSYNKQGQFQDLTIIEDGKDTSPKDIDMKLTTDTVDILTATLNTMMQTATTGECKGTSDIFDGKRRFGLNFTSTGTTTLKSSKYNMYDGVAAKCDVEITPKGGKWHEKPRGWLSIQEQGRQRGALPAIWLGQISPDLPAVPVKVKVNTQYGVLFMHLIDVQNHGIK